MVRFFDTPSKSIGFEVAVASSVAAAVVASAAAVVVTAAFEATTAAAVAAVAFPVAAVRCGVAFVDTNFDRQVVPVVVAARLPSLRQE